MMTVKVSQSSLTFCDPVDCSLTAPSVHGILQATILEWIAVPFSRGSSQPRDWTQVYCIAGGFFTIWATREAPAMMTISKLASKRTETLRQGRKHLLAHNCFSLFRKVKVWSYDERKWIWTRSLRLSLGKAVWCPSPKCNSTGQSLVDPAAFIFFMWLVLLWYSFYHKSPNKQTHSVSEVCLYTVLNYLCFFPTRSSSTATFWLLPHDSVEIFLAR